MLDRIRHTPLLVAACVLMAASCGGNALPLQPEHRGGSPQRALVADLGFQPLEFAFMDSETCAQPFQVRFTGEERVRIHERPNGNLRVMITLRNTRVIVSANDITLSSPLTGVEVVDLYSDETLIGRTVSGMNAAFTAPRHGRLLLDVGRVEFDGEGNLVKAAGPKGVGASGDVTARFCAYLGL